MRSRRALLLALLAAALVALAAGPAGAAKGMLRGIYDDAEVFGNEARAFPAFQELGVQVIRMTLRWDQVARTKPASPADPGDLAYDWAAFDRAVFLAEASGQHVLATILGAPAWANGGKAPNVVPHKSKPLAAFAEQAYLFSIAAARRYSGLYQTPEYAQLPRITRWTAWNEPNDPTFLKPQYVKKAGGYLPIAGLVYARICTAVHAGVHLAGAEAGYKVTVACGVTNPGGNNIGRAKRASTSPIPFIQWMKRGDATFDVYAHHPYNGSAFETPTGGSGIPTRIGLGDLPKLIRELDRLWPRKKYRIWLTEYGYQTNPPDKNFGVSWAKQADYLEQANGILVANPRVTMLIWFLLRDQEDLGGFQSGLVTAAGKRKPAYDVYRGLGS